MNRLDSNALQSQETHWIPLSDLMTGLMVLFLLIAVTYMMRDFLDQHDLGQRFASPRAASK